MRSAFLSLCGLAILATAATPALAAAGPCALATQAEVQAAVGGPVSEGKVNAHNKAVCDFTVGSGGSVLNISLTPKGPADSAEKMVSELKKRKIEAAVVTGFGDSAYSSSPGYGMQQFGAYKGGSHVIVTAMLFGKQPAQVQAVCQAILKKALARAQ